MKRERSQGNPQKRNSEVEVEDPQGVEESAEEKQHVVNFSDLIAGVVLVEVEVEVETLEVDTAEEGVLEAEVRLTVEGTTRKAGGLGAHRIMVQNIEAAMVQIVRHTVSVLQAAEVAAMGVVQHQIPLLTVHPAATVKDSQVLDKEVSVVLEDIARVEVMALEVVEIMDKVEEVAAATTREEEVAVAIAKVEEVAVATTKVEEVAVATAKVEEVAVAIAQAEQVVLAIAREAQVAITKVAVEAADTARVLEAAVATAKEVVATAKVVLEVATAVRATVTTIRAMVKDITNLRPRALPPPLSRHTVRVATGNSTSSRMEIRNGVSIKALDRHRIQVLANRRVKLSGASGITEEQAAAAATSSPGDTEGPRETLREWDICFGFTPGLIEILNHIGLNFLLFSDF